MEKKEISLIFCQSAIKVSSTLICYEAEIKAGNEVIIVVRNVKSIFNFLQSLKLEAKVFWFENHFKRFLKIPHIIMMLKDIDKDMTSLNVDRRMIRKVYFTSICNDPLMGCYLNQFDKGIIYKLQGKLDINNHIDDYDIPIIHYPLKIRVKRWLYSMVLRYKFRVQTVVIPTLALDIGTYKYPLIDASNLEICNRYKYRTNTTNEKNALVYASEFSDVFVDRQDYAQVFTNCIKYLHEKKYKVYIKGHPRIGTLTEAQNLSDEIIPSYIPAEFIDYKDFEMSFGLISTALCSSAMVIKSYSLLPLTKLVTDNRYQGWCDYLNKTSEGKVLFLRSFEDI